MSKPRTCPHCKKVIPLAFGFFFDQDLNLIHESCGKVVFATTEKAETEAFPERWRKSSSCTVGNYSAYAGGYQGGYQAGGQQNQQATQGQYSPDSWGD